MARYRLTEDVYSQAVTVRGEARSEGWLPAGTVVEPCAIDDSSPWTGERRGNHAPGLGVRVVTCADGTSGRGLAREVLQEGEGGREIRSVADLQQVAEFVG